LKSAFLCEVGFNVHKRDYSNLLNNNNSNLRIFSYSDLLLNAYMKTTDEIRRNNLQIAISRAGTAAALSERAGVSAAYLSQIKNQHPEKTTGSPRAMGDDVARKIEAALNESVGWMDNDHSIAGTGPGTKSNVRAIHPDDKQPDDVVYVQESRISFSAGNGRTANYELIDEEEPASYRLSWFQKYGINPDRVKRFRVSGDSMEPMLFDRDTILVNMDETNIVDNKMYAIRYGDELRVKYLRKKLDGSILLRSINPLYKEEEVSPALASEHITIIGRVRDASGTGGL
jgi:phage repressor protein C with HTH and peptisase S24 domain